MSTIELLKPVLTGGIYNTNFFNGRILTAEDLNTEQDANRKQRNRLGRAIGDGVVYGLKVGVAEEQTLYVTPGLALNRLGQSLCIPEEGLSDGKIKILLVPKIESVTGASTPFFDCKNKSESKDSVLSSTGEGVYILVMSPASEYEGRAPMVGLNDDGSITSCGKKYFVEGIQFRLVKLDLSSENINVSVRRELLSLLSKSNTASISLLRNILAHLCFGTEEILSFVQDPFNRDKSGMSPYVSYGLLDSLRSLKIPMLTDSDVPLALVFWKSNEIKVDMWSVRRSLVTRPTTELWPLPQSNRRIVEAEACFQQFQEQIESIYSSTNDNELAEINAEDYFRYLPAAGIIPISTNYLLNNDYLNRVSRPAKGFNPENFFKKYFAGMSIRKPVVIEGRNIGAIINNSLYYPSIELKSVEELIWLYLVRENLESIAKGSSNSPQPYMIFTTGHIQYQGDARYNLNRWNYSNYSKVTD